MSVICDVKHIKRQLTSFLFTKKVKIYSGVKAFWNDSAYGKRTPEWVGADTNLLIIRGSFRSLEHSDPLIITESPRALQASFAAEMKALDLITYRIIHNIDEASGYKSSLEAEKRS